MKSRRLIASPEAYEHWFKLAQSEGCALVQTQVSEWLSDVRFGSKADIPAASRHVRFTPNSGHRSALCHKQASDRIAIIG
jgi:hypothetical protein